MSTKVKRGLGLLVVAVLALIANQAAWSTGRSTAGDVIAGLAGFAFVGCLLAGLVLLAWGLLRD